jgi:hypothetical protein
LIIMTARAIDQTADFILFPLLIVYRMVGATNNV